MRLEIKTYSLMRSGHHAVLIWLAKNFEQQAEVLHVAEQMGGVTKTIVEGDGPKITVYENLRLRDEVNPSIIILRDPYNNYASYLKMIQNPNYGQFFAFPILEYWKEYAEEVIGNTNFLRNKYFINYNLWAESEEYRRNLVWEMSVIFKTKMNFDDSLKDKLSLLGGGSSFDGLEYAKTASKMKVNERYKNYADNRLYRSKVDTPEFRKLSERIFKFYPFPTVEKPQEQDMHSIMDRLF